MARLIPIGNLDRGMENDTQPVGSMREIVNLLPWRGSLRRRGPIRRAGLHDTSVTLATVPPESNHNASMKLTDKTLFSIAYTSSGTKSELHSATSSVPVATNLPQTSRIVSFGREMLVFPKVVSGSTGLSVYRWSGAHAPTIATSGTITLTAGSKHVVFGSAMANYAANDGYIYDNAGRYYAVDKALTTTTAILREPARASYSGSTWGTSNIAKLFCTNAPTGGGLFQDANTGVGASGVNVVSAAVGCIHQGRLVVGNLLDNDWSGTAASETYKPNAFRWSSLTAEGGTSATGYYAGYQDFNSTAIQHLDDDGGPILGMCSFNGALVFIRRNAVQVLTGSLASNGTDLGASINTVASGIGAGGFSAWEQFEGGIAFADEAGVYVWDGSGVENITRGKIERAYRDTMSGSADSIMVSCPGSRIMVWGSSSVITQAFVFDFNVTGWFRVALDARYGRPADTGDSYLCLSDRLFDIGGGDMVLRSYDLRGVFEDLNTDNADRAIDEDGSSATLGVYLLSNPIPLADGWQQGRVSEVVLADGGLADSPSDLTYTVRLLRGAIYSSDTESGESDLASQELCAAKAVPMITGSTVDQRLVKVRLDGAADSSHAMVEVVVTAANTSGTFAFALNGIGLVVEDNPNFGSA